MSYYSRFITKISCSVLPQQYKTDTNCKQRRRRLWQGIKMILQMMICRQALLSFGSCLWLFCTVEDLKCVLRFLVKHNDIL